MIECNGVKWPKRGSHSLLWQFERSAAHALAYIETPFEETPAMAKGSLIHTLVLEPQTFASRYAVGPDVARNTKAWKEWAEAQPEGLTLIKEADHADALRIAEAVRAHPKVGHLFEEIEKHEAEKRIEWEDEETGCPMVSIIDLWVPSLPAPLVIDLKTVSDASAKAFARKAADGGYFHQLAIYRDAIEQELGVKRVRVLNVAVETSPPFGVGLFEPSLPTMEYGRERYRTNLWAYVGAVTSNRWPGYSPEVQSWELPPWARR